MQLQLPFFLLALAAAAQAVAIPAPAEAVEARAGSNIVFSTAGGDSLGANKNKCAHVHHSKDSSKLICVIAETAGGFSVRVTNEANKADKKECTFKGKKGSCALADGEEVVTTLS